MNSELQTCNVIFQSNILIALATMSSSIPSTMQAIVAHKYGTPSEVLHLEQVPVPKPHGRDLLVRLYSGATNPVDYKKLNNFGNTSAEVDNPLIAGYDGAGVVEAVGPDAHFYKVGDQVYFAGALNRAGTFAEYTVVSTTVLGKFLSAHIRVGRLIQSFTGG